MVLHVLLEASPPWWCARLLLVGATVAWLVRRLQHGLPRSKVARGRCAAVGGAVMGSSPLPCHTEVSCGPDNCAELPGRDLRQHAWRHDCKVRVLRRKGARRETRSASRCAWWSDASVWRGARRGGGLPSSARHSLSLPLWPRSILTFSSTKPLCPLASCRETTSQIPGVPDTLKR